jgi:hypothetical protein
MNYTRFRRERKRRIILNINKKIDLSFIPKGLESITSNIENIEILYILKSSVSFLSLFPFFCFHLARLYISIIEK